MRRVALTLLLANLLSCAGDDSPKDSVSASEIEAKEDARKTQRRSAARRFIKAYDAKAIDRFVAWKQAEWTAHNRIVDDDTFLVEAAKAARDDYEKFVGSDDVLTKARKTLETRELLGEGDVAELERIIQIGATHPQSEREALDEIARLEHSQLRTLYRFRYTLDEQPVELADLRDTLFTSTDVAARQAAWEATKQAGPYLKSNTGRLRQLRNELAHSMGHENHLDAWVKRHGLTPAELSELLDEINAALRPLYRELHTWARYELAERMGQPVPRDLIPMHWFPTAYGEDWSTLAPPPYDLDALLAEHEAQEVVDTANGLYESMGYEAPPEDFWTRSSLFPPEPGSAFDRSPRPATWFIDLEQDVRVLMPTTSTTWGWREAHRQFAYAHDHLYVGSETAAVPMALRVPSDPLMVDSIAAWMAFASTQPAYLVNRGILDEDARVDEITLLLEQALTYVPFIPFAAGSAAAFEESLYVNDLPVDQFNTRWWELVALYQGMAPPGERTERWADALTRPQFHEVPGRYQDFALQVVIMFYLDAYASRQILGVGSREASYTDSAEVGEFIRKLEKESRSKPWRAALEETTGTEFGPDAMVRYFQPLMDWLVKQNVGRAHSLPEL